ncbi:uncharacterized protein V1518DRAFT_360447, partial [Limtongia smithiae]|uniref:uncharacterized protein n=1 Tax=Limtongia smithiae TaxID=1125753 RepID=UPI0034CEB828
RYPPGFSNERLKAFVERFFAAGDDAARDEEYMSYFADSAFYILAMKTAAGHSEIRRLRRLLWRSTTRRRHEIDLVFPFACGEDEQTWELGLFGRIHYEMAEPPGVLLTMEWAGRMMVALGELKVLFYQAYPCTLTIPETE